jgi:hypothetical protein
MTPDQFAAHVDQSIARALRHDSHIDESILSLTGFSTGIQRRLVSNLAHLPKENPRYLEIGLYAGATFCAAINNNSKLFAVGVEDFSQPFGQEGIRDHLFLNVRTHMAATDEEGDVRILERECFALEPGEIAEAAGGLIDIYFFDGEHSRESQGRALPHFIDAMAPLFLFMVDDANWATVREGTADGFAALRDRVKIEREWHLVGEKKQDDPIWWNGVSLYLCSKL